MSDKTGIEWCDATWNPTRGCSKVSEGCRFCYAMGVAARFSGPGQPYEGLARMTKGGAEWTGEVRVVEDALTLPLRWRRPRRIFVDSMSDLFHEKVSDSDIARVFAVMAVATRHTFQVLTKRPERMAALLSSPEFLQAASDQALLVLNEVAPVSACIIEAKDFRWPLPNVWLGTSVENQEAADERIPHLLRTPAAVRFISAEPLLGPVNLLNVRTPDGLVYDALRGLYSTNPIMWHERARGRIDWVIAGGESGPGARPMHPDWARSLRDQCKEAGVAFFFKQWGEHLPIWLDDEWGFTKTAEGRRIVGDAIPRAINDAYMRGEESERLFRHPAEAQAADMPHWACWRVGKKRAGHLLDGKEHHEFPEGRA